MIRTFAKAALVIGALSASAGLGMAQSNYPAAPIRFIIPLAPGGAIDVMARALGKAFEARTGQGFVVESRPGANTIIAANACKGAAPDGYTICLLSSSSITMNPSLYKSLSYEPLRDFEPITQVAFADQVLVANAKVPIKDWKELVEFSKKNPDKMNYGSFGVGGDTHLIVEWLKHETGAKITHIPYKGSSESMMAFAANDVQVLYLIVGNMDLVRQINEGEVRGLLIGGNQRSPLVPNVPSFAEVGLTSAAADYQTWFGIFAPKGTPPAIVKKLNAELAAVLKTKAFADQNLTPRGFRAVGNTPDEFRKFIVEDQKRGKILVEISGAKLEQ
jgi:tripartite-type tricarboxylate transporter receptor subunit TctC